MAGISEQGGSIQGQEIPIFGGKQILDDEGWGLLTDGIGGLAQIADEYGISLTYHHHMGTVVQTIEETRRLLDSTREEDLGLLYDTGHFAFGGEDHIAALKEFLPRVKHVHLKDVRKNILSRVKSDKMSFLKAVLSGAFTVPGDGDLAYEPVFDLLESGGFSGWMVVEAEQDPAEAPPFEYAKKGRAYITSLTGI
ncbi:MAG: TIM barrel protein [Spirochaetales bacterium]|nr:TIM barrel protein [Spirochaetales bacterium]